MPDQLESQPPTAVIVEDLTAGDIPTVREILPPERHLSDVPMQRQAETVRGLQTDTDEYELPTLRSEGLVRRVRVEMRRRRAEGRLFGKYVSRPT